ncbi:hypothetical protein D3C73_740200 [compost metagenome]
MDENYLTANDLDTIEKWITQVEDMHDKQMKFHRNDALKIFKLPYKLIGLGRSRFVYDLKNGYVLKIAFSFKGIKDNKSEALLYNSALPAVKKHLAAVVHHGHGWCIMVKVNESYNNKNVDLVYKLQDELLGVGINPKDLTNKRNNEPRWKNFRIDPEGHIVVIDYANFKKIKSFPLSPTPPDRI